MVVNTLGKIASYPDIDHALTGVDQETNLPVKANLTVSVEHSYTCKTCTSEIKVEEKHIVVAGIYSLRRRDNHVFDHHHHHTECFHTNELPFWDEINVVKMEKERREIILKRLRLIRAAKSSHRINQSHQK